MLGHNDPSLDGYLYDPIKDWTMNSATLSALQKHLAARLMTNDNPEPRVVLSAIKTMVSVAYSAYNSGPARGEQKYRAASNKRSGRDASFVMVSMTCVYMLLSSHTC